MAPQRMEGASEASGHLKGRSALQRLEGVSKARGRLREWRGLRGWRVPQRLEDTSKAGPHRLEDASKAGRRL